MGRGRVVVERQRKLEAASEDGGPTGTATAGGSRVAPRPDAPDRIAGPAPEWSAIGHELRTPLNAILGGVELLLDGSAGPLSADARACLGDVQVAGRQLMRQTDWLMLLAQANAAAPPGPLATLDLAGLVRAALGPTRPRADDSTRASEDATFLVRGDGFWLDVLAKALAEICLVREGAGAPRLETCRTRDDRRSALGVVCPGIATSALPPVPWCLMEAIVALHGGEVAASDGRLWLIWPEARMLSG